MKNVEANKARARQYAQEWRARLISRGLCVKGCGNGAVPGELCADCKAKARAHWAERKKTGLCLKGCGRSRVNKTMCRECADAQMVRRRHYVSEGLCALGCRRPLATKTYCRICADRVLDSNHGLSRGETTAVFAQVKNCQACGAAFGERGRFANSPCIDHDHSTGERRGVLCSACNKALGHMQDSATRLRALADYIDRVNARDK